MLDTSVVGRKAEFSQIQACLTAGKNVLLEGPVGVGKTHLALAIAKKLGRPFFRIDGDGRYTEQKLAGWFDPPTVLKKGYVKTAFVPGPLVEAMKQGGVLFVNELNRLPEGVQNILLPAIDEKRVEVPHYGEVLAKDGFLVIATQNPKEFVATSHLSEALMDRFELVVLRYQTLEEELEIIKSSTQVSGDLALWSIRLIRTTREDKRFRRGASIRAAQSIVQVATELRKQGSTPKDAFLAAVAVSVPSRIEIEHDQITDRDVSESIQVILKELAERVMSGGSLSSDLEKKKNH